MTARVRGLRVAVAAAALCGVLAATVATAQDATLREQWLQARWPADLVAVGDRYAAASHDAGVRDELARARQTRRLLERADIRLYRADFAGDVGGDAARADVRRAALGDKEAAWRMAQRCRDGSDGVAASPQRWIGWLQYAAALGHGGGSYELALHYRRENQPALAAPYEARAEELGFKPPPALDHVRK